MNILVGKLSRLAILIALFCCCLDSCRSSFSTAGSSPCVYFHLASADSAVSLGRAAASGRTIRPSASSLSVGSYHVVGSGPNGASYTGDFTSSDFSIDAIAAGSWTFSVTAMASGAAILSGSGTVAIIPSYSTSISIALSRASGNGNVSLTANFAADLSLASFSGLKIEALSSSGGITNTTTVDLSASGSSLSYSASLAAGDYRFSASFTDSNGNTLYLNETVQVFSGLTSQASYSYAEKDFTADSTAVTGVYLGWSSMYLVVGETVALSCTVCPTNAADTSVTWSSSDSSIASVGNGGSVNALAKGTARITATTLDGGYAAVCKVTVGATDYTLGSAGPAGGLVFYDAGNYSTYGWRYLECAPSDLSTGIQWYNGTYLSISTGTAIGSGASNTAAIVAAQGSGVYAAELCADFTLNGFSGWYLPSYEELHLVYTNLETKSLGNLASANYWTSTQYNANYVQQWAFSSGLSWFADPVTKYYVRPIRSF
jgi:uncharacterized protein YjdB